MDDSCLKNNPFWTRAIVLSGIFLAILFAVIALGVYFFSPAENTIQRDGLVLQSPGTVQYARVRIGGTTIFAEIVETPEDRIRGLSGRDGLEFGRGMLFLFDEYGYYPIWMKGMKFPIDIIWIADNRIVDMKERVIPPPAPEMPDKNLPMYRPRSPAYRILEVPAGFAEAHGIHNGQTVIID